MLPLPQIGSSVDMAPGLREPIGLALLAGLGCGAALAHGDLFFVAVFGLAIAMSVVRGDATFSVQPSENSARTDASYMNV